ncbi:MAG: hypothetical protein ACP5FH_03705 [Terracidiphilus sp.]
MEKLIHWMMDDGNLLALMVAGGVAVFLFCCLECATSPQREKDDLFRRHEL